jgi:hypothetical protein
MEQRKEQTVINTNPNPYTTVCNGSVMGIIERLLEQQSSNPSQIYLSEHELLSYGVAVLSDN